MQTIIENIAKQYGLKRGNGKYVGPCPECGGSGTSDRFNIRDDGGYKCYSCDFKGDLISWLRNKEGMSCPEAHQAIDKDCTNTGCAVRAKCRMGDGNPSGYRRPHSVSPVSQDQARTLPTTEVKAPKDRWQDWAVSMVAAGIQKIQAEPEVLSWLASRGIDQAAVRRFNLGWQPKNSKIDRDVVGLAPRDDGKKHLWIPDGLVIPIYDDYAMVHRLRIRRPPESRDRFLPDLKYVWMEGSGTAPLVIRPQATTIRGAVIVEAELDAMACAAAHPDVLIIALGTVSAGLPDQLRAELAGLPVLLIALDADITKNSGGSGAGPKAIAAWTREFRQAKYWPVPEGKDPGDYAMAGGDLHAWIEAGLPPQVGSAAPHEHISVPACPSPGGPGQDTLTPKSAENGLNSQKQTDKACGIETAGKQQKQDSLPAVMELVGLMSESGIRIWIKSGSDLDRLCVDWRGNDAWVTENRTKARRLEDLLYRVEESVSLLALLDDGLWDHSKLSWFAGY